MILNREDQSQDEEPVKTLLICQIVNISETISLTNIIHLLTPGMSCVEELSDKKGINSNYKSYLPIVQGGTMAD